jgi:hypothetical protein
MSHHVAPFGIFAIFGAPQPVTVAQRPQNFPFPRLAEYSPGAPAPAARAPLHTDKKRHNVLKIVSSENGRYLNCFLKHCNILIILTAFSCAF